MKIRQMKPVILYVDDEVRNLSTFEAILPEEWDIQTFENAIEALRTIKEIKPWVIVSDQRMPGMTGLEFLEVANQIVPKAIRIIVTGQTEEETIIQLVKRAKIYDYITKPWEADDLESCLKKSVDYYQAIIEREEIFKKIQEQNKQLEKKNEELLQITRELKKTKEQEKQLLTEVSAWAPSQIVQALREKTISFPMKRDIVGITFDIIDSSLLHNVYVHNLPVRTHVLRIFTEAILRNGGLRESHAGDSAYGHFGAFNYLNEPFIQAISAAQEFRVGLTSFSKVNKVPVECGSALHFAPKTLFQLYEFRGDTPQGMIIQKSYDSASTHIDLLHRMEKLAHKLPGSNVIMSKEFFERLNEPLQTIRYLGMKIFKGQDKKTHLYLLPSYYVTDKILEEFCSNANIS